MRATKLVAACLLAFAAPLLGVMLAASPPPMSSTLTLPPPPSPSVSAPPSATPSATPTASAAPSPSPTARPTSAPSETRPDRPRKPVRTTRVAPPSRDRAGWKLVWADEFSGGRLDTGKWDAEDESTYGDGNQELACLLDRRENMRLEDGELVLTARRESRPYVCNDDDDRFPDGRRYTSAHLSTKGKAAWTYGRFEMRAKLPTTPGNSKGLWPAFWLRPASGGIGELDVMEAVGSDASGDEWRRIHQTIHYDYKPTYRFQAKNYKFANGFPADGYHTYAAEWEPGEIRWYIDGKLTYVRNRSTTHWIDDAFDRPFYLRLNLAVGGRWPGDPNSATRLPAQYRIDYVRVYQ